MEPAHYKESILTNQQLTQRIAATQNRFDGLDKLKIWAYGVGHFINDLVAACWFNYLFYFLKKVVDTDAAPSALLSGQICDGIATPLVGLFSDKCSTRFGQRKPWYVGGLILVVACFIPLFSGYTNKDNPQSEYLFYTFFPGLFNIGWAALQISHMSLVPSLTCSRKRRDKLNNLRNLFTFIANFFVLGTGLIIFSVMTDRNLEYQLISYLVVSLGLISSIFFLVNIDQVELTKICHEKAELLKLEIAAQKKVDIDAVRAVSQFSQDSDTSHQIKESRNFTSRSKESIFDWFKMPKFYLFGICYMGVRLYTNIFGTFLPFYLTDVLKLGVDQNNKDKISFNLALVPMLVYFTSVIVSTQLNWFYHRFGRKQALLVGTLICIVCLTVMIFLTEQTSWIMYILALFIGCSQSMVLSTGINFISDVVGNKAKTGAFVFGIYSLLDKFSAGAVIFIVGNSQSYSKSNDDDDFSDYDKSYIRWTMVLIPGLSCILASAIVLSYPIQQYKKDTSMKDQLLNKKKSELEEQLVS